MKIIFGVLLLAYLSSARICCAEKQDSLLSLFEKRVTTSPSDWETLNGYKTLCDSLKVLDRGIDFIKQLVEKKKNIPELHTILGLFYIAKIEEVGDIEKGFLAGSALDEFNRALKVDSLSWSALYSRAMLYLNMPPEFAAYELSLKNFHKLLYIQQEADILESHFVLTYISLGDLYFKMKKKEKAIKTWKEGLEIFPHNNHLKNRISSK